MRLFRKITHICQNCIHGNNEKGKFIYKWYRKGIGIDFDKDDNLIKSKKGEWYIFCEKKRKLIPWNRYKRCFIPENWIIPHDIRHNRNGVLRKHYCIIYEILDKKDKESVNNG